MMPFKTICKYNLNVIGTIKILFLVGNAICFLGIVMHVFGLIEMKEILGFIA